MGDELEFFVFFVEVGFDGSEDGGDGAVLGFGEQALASEDELTVAGFDEVLEVAVVVFGNAGWHNHLHVLVQHVLRVGVAQNLQGVLVRLQDTTQVVYVSADVHETTFF